MSRLACGEISMDASHATLIISNGTMELVSTGPLALSMQTPTVRVSMTYVVNGNQLDITQICPPDTGASGPRAFTVSG